MIYLVTKEPKDDYAAVLRHVALFVEAKSKAHAVRQAKQNTEFMLRGTTQGCFKTPKAVLASVGAVVYL